MLQDDCKWFWMRRTSRNGRTSSRFLLFEANLQPNQMPVGPMNPCRSIDGFCAEITNPIYLEAQVELGGKLVISRDETHATRRLASGFGRVEHLETVAPARDSCFSKRICTRSDASWPNEPNRHGGQLMDSVPKSHPWATGI